MAQSGGISGVLHLRLLHNALGEGLKRCVDHEGGGWGVRRSCTSDGRG
jgi:hypothetical protein